MEESTGLVLEHVNPCLAISRCQYSDGALQSAVELLQAQKPTRVALFLRTKSPLYSDNYNQVVPQTCSVLSVPHEKSRLLAIQKWTRLSAIVSDIFHDDYDVSKGHHKADLPVLHVDYAGRVRTSASPAPNSGS